ncbi:MAG: amidohydrolase family protein [Burkholderiales bacterium]|jgi:cytosine deaminase|nr:amidohydrolase family protein [Burkholderiales bacterium]
MSGLRASPAAPQQLLNARLPAWLLGDAWPRHEGAPALARVQIEGGRVVSVVPMDAAPCTAPAWDVGGTLLLPAFVDAHVHLDKAFTLSRITGVQPGLLGAIEASSRDVPTWTPEDIRTRATRGLQWAHECGTTRLRTHVNWSEIGPLPMAWPVLAELSRQWGGRVLLELVSLTKLISFADAANARTVAAQVKATGPHALLGGFVHSSNWDRPSLAHLLDAAAAQDLDVDLHTDEELNPEAHGLLAVAELSRAMGFAGRIVCGHVCALAAMPESQALAVLDAVARAPITLVSLPITNLLLQDAVTGRTPRQRGITLVKEARARGIPLLFASDNVQDPFCPVGSFDPLEAFAAGVLAAQLDAPFDRWSDTLCRHDFLARGRPGPASLAGQPADLLLFPDADATGFPSRTARRVVLRAGVADSAPPAAWLAPATA